MDIINLDFIKECVKERRIRWSYHVNMRLEQRSISREIIVSSSGRFEIIEEYPDDKFLPSCLVYSEYQNIKFHVVVALDYEDKSIVIVTAYIPSLEKWHNDLKTRRKQ